MVILILLLATVMTAVWFLFMNMVSREDWVNAAYNKVLDNLVAIEKMRLKDEANKKKLAEYHGLVAKVMRLFLGGSSERKIAKLEEQNTQLQSGNLKSVRIFVLPGYVIQRKFDQIVHSSFYKTIMTRSLELYGKKHAANKTKQLVAKLISYPLLCVPMSLTLGALIIGLGNTPVGIAVLSVGTMLVLVLVYAMYDELKDHVNKRREAIARQFPSVVSKLALLVTSGMIMNKAWRETAYSENLELYREMQKVSEELDNLVNPEIAYSEFINRCSTKEATKLASAIIQNLSKGNAEIGILLKEMAREAWLERRHTAKRDSEKANAKLMIPTMLLFLAILVMIMVPVVMNFSSL